MKGELIDWNCPKCKKGILRAISFQRSGTHVTVNNKKICDQCFKIFSYQIKLVEINDS